MIKITDVLKRLTKIKVFIFFILLLVSVIIGSYLYFSVSTGGSFSLNTNMSSAFQEYIDSFVDKTPNIAGLQIIKVDLQRNIRYIAYTSIKDPEARKLYSGFLSNNITTELPVFTGTDTQNMRMITIINHEFICYPFVDSLSYVVIPEMAKYTTTICATSIPPEFGKFSGFVAVFLIRPPTPIEQDIIRIESTKIAVGAYGVIK